MPDDRDARSYAEAQVAAARDDPGERFDLVERTCHCPTGHAPRHLPFRRAALSFVPRQARRGVLEPLDASPPAASRSEQWPSPVTVTRIQETSGVA
jgi:hypothetical protein